MATAHKKYGGSSIELIGLCPGSPKAKAALPQTTNEDAARGNRIHGWLEQYMKGNLTPPAKKLTGEELKEAQIGAAAGYAIKGELSRLGFDLGEANIERMLDFIPGYGLPNEHFAGGTPDIDAYRAFHDIVVIDLKTGNQQVSPVKNKQLLMYACSIYNSLDPFDAATLNNVHLIIVQTQADSLEPVVRTWTTPAVDLPAWTALFKSQIDRAEENPDLRTPGDHCIDNWCDARATCAEHLRYVDEQSAGAFNRLLAGEPAAVITAEMQNNGNLLAAILNAESAINAVLKKANELGLTLSKLKPGAVPGWIADTGLSNRKWADEKKAEKELKLLGFKIDEIAPRTLISPNKAEELLKARAKASEDVTGSKSEIPPIPETVRDTTAPRLKKGEPTNVFANFAPEEANPKDQTAVMAAAGSTT